MTTSIEKPRTAWATQNWNLFAASLLIATWKKLGVHSFFVSPGYRNAPLIAALQMHDDLTIVSCFDERAAAYQALGAAKASQKPSVLMCTSGTAGANYLPALAEANTDQVPLIVVTADRPFELVHAAAQQVIDQRQLFGRFVKQSFDFPAPDAHLQERAWIGYSRDLFALAMAAPEGPVHMNLPFHTPLDPVAVADGPSADRVRQAMQALEVLPGASELSQATELSDAAAQYLRDTLRQSQRGFLVIGRLARDSDRRAALLLQRQLGWPCLVDIGSGLKGRCEHEILDVGHPRMAALLAAYAPDMVVHVGRRLVSRHFDDFLKTANPPVYWVFSSQEGAQDPMHLPQRMQSTASLSSLLIALRVEESQSSAAHDALMARTEALRHDLQEVRSPLFGFADVAQTLNGLLPRMGHGLFLGNSLAIRAFDSWLFHPGRLPRIEANRGVSGIEGLLATTMGLARASEEMWTLVIGDISLLHDLNSVVGLKSLASPVIVVLVNNGGGRIFETLPIAAHAWVKDPLISTPHELQFAGIAQMADIPYTLCRDAAELGAAYERALKAGQSCLIECWQSPDADKQYLQLLREV